MSLWTIVPVKPFNEGKSRLAAHISPRQRRALNRELLTRTLAAINQAHLDAQLLVVSRDGGTNALMLQPAQAIPFAFGPDSFLRHQRLAAEAGIPIRVVESDSLLFDIDLPEDYRLLFDNRGP